MLYIIYNTISLLNSNMSDNTEKLRYFGQEDLSFIYKPDFYDLFLTLMKSGRAAIPLYIRYKYYNDNYRHNQNIRGKISDGKNTIDVFTKNGWSTIKKRDFTREVLDKMQMDFTMIIGTMAYAEKLHDRVFDDAKKNELSYYTNKWMKTIGSLFKWDMHRNLKMVEQYQKEHNLSPGLK
jgi:hypothetical protein